MIQPTQWFVNEFKPDLIDLIEVLFTAKGNKEFYLRKKLARKFTLTSNGSASTLPLSNWNSSNTTWIMSPLVIISVLLPCKLIVFFLFKMELDWFDCILIIMS